MQKKERNWTFTKQVNERREPTPEDFLDALKSYEPTYFLFQLEKGRDTGKLHYQGYIIFKNARAFGWQKANTLTDRMHTEVMRKGEEANHRYCSKSDTRLEGPWDYGKRKKVNGNTTLEAAAEAIISGLPMQDIARDHSVAYVKHHTGLTALNSTLNYLPKDGDTKTQLWIFTGERRTGKSWAARTMAGGEPNIARPLFGNSGLWWGTYTQQPFVILDDFNSNCPLGQLNRLADYYPSSIEAKGTEIPFNSKVIIITSNLSFDLWYPNCHQEQKSALMDRCELHAQFYVTLEKEIQITVLKDEREEKIQIPPCPHIKK